MAEAQNNKAGGEDPSMEEILQSIRRIIAEDGDETKPGAATPNGGVQGSDVLELTEMVSDDGSVVSLKEGQAAPAAAQPAAPAGPKLETPPPAAAPAAAAPPAAAPAAPAAPTNDVLSQIEEALATPAAPAASADALLSTQAAGAATAALKKLQAATEPPIPTANTTPSPVFQSGNSVESMVAAMIKPMIKEWLDSNLPKIVERIVTIEIRRLSK